MCITEVLWANGLGIGNLCPCGMNIVVCDNWSYLTSIGFGYYQMKGWV